MMPQIRTVIAIDGLAGTGKTTLSRELANRLGFIHLNTGLLYRGVALAAERAGIAFADEPAISQLMARHIFSLGLTSSRTSQVLIDGAPVVEDIQRPRISEGASIVSQFKGVRDALLDSQRRAYPGTPIVAEGRDMGTVVFPDAPLKFYVYVDQETRVRRRLSQLGYSDATDTAATMIQKEIIDRDRRDEERALAPARPAQDAVIVDNSSRSLTEVLQGMYDAASERGLILFQ